MQRAPTGCVAASSFSPSSAPRTTEATERSKMAFQDGTSDGFIPDGNDGVEGSSAGGKRCKGKGDARHFEVRSPVEDGLV